MQILKHALQKLYKVINSHMSKQPNGIVFLDSDFNQTDLETVLAKFHQRVHIPTRGGNTLDCVYKYSKQLQGNSCPHFGQSDYISLRMLAIYSQLVKRVKPSYSMAR